MKIETYFDKNVIIITDPIQKMKLLNYASDMHIIFACKIYTIQEYKEKYLFTYHDKTILEIMKKEKVIPSIAAIYMNLLYYIKEKEYKTEKANHLSSLFTYLKEKKCIHIDSIFLKFMENKKIILYELDTLKKEDKAWLHYLSKHNEVISVNEEKKKCVHSLYVFDEIEEEVSAVANKILSLIHHQISPDQIKVLILNDDYKSIIKRVFTLYHIPFEIKEAKPLIVYDMTKYFLFLIEETEDVNEIPFLIRENYDLTNPFLKEIYDSLIQILNKYSDVREIPLRNGIIKYECEKETIIKNQYENVVEVKGIYQDYIDENARIFILGASLSYFPTLYKDEDYLSDIEKEEICFTTSFEKNKLEEKKLENFLNTHKYVDVSYARFSNQREYAKASFLNTLLENGNLQFQKIDHYSLSKDYNSYLLSLDLDAFINYNKISETLPLLYHNVSAEYKTYRNEYTKIDEKKLLSYLDHKITLSYTSLENFYKCKFRFYLQNILKIKEEKKEEIEINFGNIVHQVLEMVFKKEEDIEKIMDTAIFSYYTKENCTAKEMFYIEKYKKEMKKMIAILKEQKERSSFVETYLEKEIYEIISYQNLKVKLMGKIDKVCTYKENEKTYAMIIDYKTGNTNLDINRIFYGLGMQLFLYYMLLKKEYHLSFGGVYLQNVMKDVLPSKTGYTYEKLLFDAYKLDGYTIKQKEIVHKIDKEENSFIKTMRFKKDGDFYFNARVLEEDTIEKLLYFVEKNIKNAIKDIYNSDFSINPKQIGFEKEDEETGCKYCPYRDICFRENKDILFLPNQKNLEFLKGDIYE